MQYVSVNEFKSRFDLIECELGSDIVSPASIVADLNPSSYHLSIMTHHEIMGFPIDMKNNVRIRYDVDVPYGYRSVNALELVDWLKFDEMQQLLRRVCDGHSIKYDGNNNVGHLNEDAEEAHVILENKMLQAPSLNGGLCSAADYLDGIGGYKEQIFEFNITPHTSDDELDNIAKDIKEWAEMQDTVLVGLIEHLNKLKSEAQNLYAERQ